MIYPKEDSKYQKSLAIAGLPDCLPAYLVGSILKIQLHSPWSTYNH